MSQNSISNTLLSNNSLHHTWLINILPYSPSKRQKVSLWTRENIMHHTHSHIATPQVLTAMCARCSGHAPWDPSVLLMPPSTCWCNLWQVGSPLQSQGSQWPLRTAAPGLTCKAISSFRDLMEVCVCSISWWSTRCDFTPSGLCRN